jgi:hypothetical protein
VRAGLVGRFAREQDHVDDGIERSVEEDVERLLGVVDAFGGDLVDRHRGGGSRHRRSSFVAVASSGFATAVGKAATVAGYRLSADCLGCLGQE